RTWVGGRACAAVLFPGGVFAPSFPLVPRCGPVSGPDHPPRPKVSRRFQRGDLRSAAVAGSGDPTTTRYNESGSRGRADRVPGPGRAGEDFACRQDLTGRFVPVWGLYPSAPLVPA